MPGLVTGASSGIGEAFAARLAAGGVPGLGDPSMIEAVSQAQQVLLMTSASSPLAERYRKDRRT